MNATVARPRLGAPHKATPPLFLVDEQWLRGTDDGDDRGGCRSSVELGIEATTAAEMRGWHLRLLRSAVKTWVCSVGRYGDCGHDGDIAGDVELSAKTGLRPRDRTRPGEKGKTTRGLTVNPFGGSVGSRVVQGSRVQIYQECPHYGCAQVDPIFSDLIYILLYVTLSVKVLKKSMASSLAGSKRGMMV